MDGGSIKWLVSSAMDVKALTDRQRLLNGVALAEVVGTIRGASDWAQHIAGGSIGAGVRRALVVIAHILAIAFFAAFSLAIAANAVGASCGGDCAVLVTA